MCEKFRILYITAKCYENFLDDIETALKTKSAVNTVVLLEGIKDVSAPKFQQWLMTLMFKHGCNYQICKAQPDSFGYIKTIIKRLIRSKYKNQAFLYQQAQSKHSDKSVEAGYRDQFSLIWIDVLM